MVRLKVALQTIKSNIEYFNSTMVRLKAAGRLRGGCVVVFQFHYGTIKRRKNYGKDVENSISIPLWYD